MQITIRNQASEIELVQAAFNDFAQRHSIPVPVATKFIIIFDEVLSNIISYGYNDTDEHQIEVRFYLEGGRLSVAVADDGIPFNPLASKSPDTAAPLEDREIGGLGIHVVKNLVEDVSYQRWADKNLLTVVELLNPARSRSELR